ncbi:unnamed protein product [Rotaria magnacalcarata]
MEYLPDELLLLSFRYLHRFDLLYTFKDLNRRFQQIVEPYLYKVNLTQANLSYKHFRLFVKHILPSHGNSIRSLTVSGLQLFDLVRLHLHHLPSLESITLKRPLIDTVRSDKLEKFLIQVLRIPTLTHLSIDYHGGIIFELISKYAAPNLQTLKVLHSYDFYYFGYVTQQSPYLKRLSINLMSTIDLVKLFQVAVNLNQLNLSLYTFADLEVREVPDTLEKLHLEIDFRLLKSKNNKKSLHQSNFHMLSKLLNNFRNNLKYLDLIVLNAEKEFSDFDKLHSLVNNFDQLETFEYDIRTKYRPDQRFPNVEELISANSTYSVYTNPRPQPFDTSFKRVEFEKKKLNSDLTRSQLLVATSLDVTDGDFFDVNLPSSFELSDDLKLTLTTLNLERNNIGAEGAQHLAQALHNNTALTILNLQFNNIDDEAVRHLAQELHKHTTLTTLNLGGNDIGAEGAQHLAEALHSNTTLRALGLEWNNIGAEGAQHLAQALHNNTVRQFLFFSTAHTPLFIKIDTHHSRSSTERYQLFIYTTTFQCGK